MCLRCNTSRSGSTRLIVLVAVLVVGALAAIWLWTRPVTQPSSDAGQAVAEAFLKEIREGRPEAAWESTTAEFKSAQGRESFVREVKGAAGWDKPLHFVSTQTVTIHDEQRSEFLFQLDTGAAVRIVLGRDAGAWKVDHWVRAK